MAFRIFLAEGADVFPGVIAKNQGLFNYERFMHRTFYPQIIHPYSKFRVYWEIAMLFFWLTQVFSFFLICGFVGHFSVAYFLLLTLPQVVNFVDFVLMFYTGYVESTTGIVVLVPKKIALRYLRGTFVLDFIASFPLVLLVYFLGHSWFGDTTFGENLKRKCIIYASAAVVFCRIASCNRYLKNTHQVKFWNPFLFHLITFACYFFLVVFLHFLYKSLYLFLTSGNVYRNLYLWENFAILFEHFYIIIFSYFFESRIEFGWNCVVLIPILIFNFFFGIYLTSYLIKYARLKMRTKERYLALESSVRIFVRKRQMPFSLRQKTLLYFQVFLQSSRYKEDEIVNYFPETFKSDMFSHLCIPLLKGFYAFEDLPIYVLRRLAECLKYQLFLPNELVMKRTEPKLSMYFIKKGTVALYSNNIELYHFDRGCINGKYFLEENTSTNQYAISLEVTEIYRMDHDDFMEIMGAYPQLLENIQDKFVLASAENHDLIERSI